MNDKLLVYLDNVYAYGRVTGSMTEASEIRPGSRCGEVRCRRTRELDEGHPAPIPPTYTPDIGDAPC